MQIHDLNTKALTDPAYVAFDDGTDTYKADFGSVIDDAVTAAFSTANVSGGIVNYTSEDAEPLSGASWANFDLFEGGENLAALFTLVSEMAYNVRWLKNRFTVRTYSVTPTGNTNVEPFLAYVETSISSDASTYGTPIAISAYGGGSTNPTLVKFNASRTGFWTYSKTAGTAVSISILYMQA